MQKSLVFIFAILDIFRIYSAIEQLFNFKYHLYIIWCFLLFFPGPSCHHLRCYMCTHIRLCTVHTLKMMAVPRGPTGPYFNWT